MTKKIFYIFIFAFIFNLVWENLHAILYFLPNGESITQYMLLRSTFFDAIFITLMGGLFLKVPYFKQRLSYSLLFGVIVAIAIELYALQTGRWAYNELMPIIPLLETGLTPTIQLGFISYIVYKFVNIKQVV